MPPRRDIKAEIAGRETEILTALGIPWPPPGRQRHINCPFPDHDDKHPSWRWDDRETRWHCTCGSGDVLDAAQRMGKASDFPGAADYARDVCGLEKTSKAYTNGHAPSEHGNAARAVWQPIHPVPADAPKPDLKHYKHGKPASVWEYLDAQGKLLGIVCRFDLPDGSKEIVPLSYCAHTGNGKRAWRWLSFAKPRPLYGLDLLAERPEAPVLLVEGEKTADAAEPIAPDYITVTWPGGTGAVGMVDWEPLRGRDVVLWPDHDLHVYPDSHSRAGEQKPLHEQPGLKAMHRIAQALDRLAASVRIVDTYSTQTDFPDGWDLADALPEGITRADLRRMIVEAKAPDELPPESAPEHAQPERAAPPASDDDGKPVVRIYGGALSEAASEAEKHLIDAGAHLYQRGDKLVRPVLSTLKDARKQDTRSASLASVETTYLRDLLCRHMRWERFARREKEWIGIDPPREVAETIIARGSELGFRPVTGVIMTPTLRPDGSVLSQAGYDDATGLLVIDPLHLPDMPQRPSFDQAYEALNELDGLLDEFPFVSEAARTVALSMILTSVTRGAYPAVPMHAVRAPAAGTGKSFLVDLVSVIATGELCPVLSGSPKPEEMEKRLGAAAIAGYPIVSLDNVNADLGGDFLCQMIERPMVAPRLLGKSELVKVPNTSTLFATGNNMRFVGDMTRRVLICDLDRQEERPEQHQFAKRPLDAVRANRGKYIAAALTVVSAYLSTHRPASKPLLASFEDWSRTVREALLWLGREDPVSTIEAARSDDPEREALAIMITAWAEVFGTGANTAAPVSEAISKSQEREFSYDDIGRVSGETQKLKNSHLHEALMQVSPRGQPNSRSLGWWLKRNEGKIVYGQYFRSVFDGHLGARRWYVEKT